MFRAVCWWIDDVVLCGGRGNVALAGCFASPHYLNPHVEDKSHTFFFFKIFFHRHPGSDHLARMCRNLMGVSLFSYNACGKKKKPSSRRRIKEIYLHLIHRCYHLLYGTYFSKILCDASSSQHNPPLDALISGFFGRRRSTLSRGFGSWASRVLFCFFLNFCFVPFGLPSERTRQLLCPLPISRGVRLELNVYITALFRVFIYKYILHVGTDCLFDLKRNQDSTSRCYTSRKKNNLGNHRFLPFPVWHTYQADRISERVFLSLSFLFASD